MAMIGMGTDAVNGDLQAIIEGRKNAEAAGTPLGSKCGPNPGYSALLDDCKLTLGGGPPGYFCECTNLSVKRLGLYAGGALLVLYLLFKGRG